MTMTTRAHAAVTKARTRREDEWARRAALVRKARSGPKGRDVVLKGLRDREGLVVVEAIEKVVELQLHDVESTLVDLLGRDEEVVRSYAAWALGSLGAKGSETLRVLKRLFRAEPATVFRSALAEACFRLNGEPRFESALLRQLRARDPDVRIFTANSIVGIVTKENQTKLVKRMREAMKAERSTLVRLAFESSLDHLKEPFPAHA
jgi:HEAT repeat protein